MQETWGWGPVTGLLGAQVGLCSPRDEESSRDQVGGRHGVCGSTEMPTLISVFHKLPLFPGKGTHTPPPLTSNHSQQYTV